jgi:hypothetical protein
VGKQPEKQSNTEQLLAASKHITKGKAQCSIGRPQRPRISNLKTTSELDRLATVHQPQPLATKLVQKQDETLYSPAAVQAVTDKAQCSVGRPSRPQAPETPHNSQQQHQTRRQTGAFQGAFRLNRGPVKACVCVCDHNSRAHTTCSSWPGGPRVVLGCMCMLLEHS